MHAVMVSSGLCICIARILLSGWAGIEACGALKERSVDAYVDMYGRCKKICGLSRAHHPVEDGLAMKPAGDMKAV